MSSEMLGQQALPRVGHRWVKRATIAAVILLALCLFLVGLDCLVAGPTGGCAVIVGQAAIVTSAFLVSVVVQMLGNSRVRHVSGRHKGRHCAGAFHRSRGLAVVHCGSARVP